MAGMTGFGRALLHSKPAQVGEIVALFVVALAVIVLAAPLAGRTPWLVRVWCGWPTS